MIKLEPIRHFYYDTDTGERFPSMTSSALKLVIKPFEGDKIIENTIASYIKFQDWYTQFDGKSNKEFIELIKLFYTYKNHRPFTYRENDSGTYKSFKRITDYDCKIKLRNELLQIKYTNPDIRQGKCYTRGLFDTFNHEEIKELWVQLALVATTSGTLLHEIIETFFIKRFTSGELLPELEHLVQENWDQLKIIIDRNVKKYPLNKEFFENYIIDTTLEEYKKHVIDSFLKLGADLGHSISEMIVCSRYHYLAGTMDTKITFPTRKSFKVNDHKTNNVFEYDDDVDKYMLPPFDHIKSSDESKFTLQTSGYSKIIESQTKEVCEGIWISYYNRKNQSFQRIDLEYKPDLAEELLELHRRFIIDLRHKSKDYLKFFKVEEKHKNHLCSLLHNYGKELKSKGYGKEFRKEVLGKFIEDYKTWENK